MRDRKVEELKKRLCEQGVELPTLSSRKELIVAGDEAFHKPNDGNCKFFFLIYSFINLYKDIFIDTIFQCLNPVSNPPPSPEACEQTELDLKSIPINLVTNDEDEGISEKPSTSHGIETTLETYEDDFLDVNCGDMDYF